MTYEEMDGRLRGLEPYEQKLKDKICRPDYSGFEQITYKQKGKTIQVYVMGYSCSETFDAPGRLRTARGHTVYVDKKRRNLFMNKNARFAEVEPHVHDWVELGYMYSGSCTQTVGETEIQLKQGQIIILDSGIPHAIGYTGENDILINMLMEKEFFDHSFYSRLADLGIITEFLMNVMSEQTYHDSYIVFDSEKDRRIQLFMKELICEFLSPTSMEKEIINNLIVLLFSELVNVYENGNVKELAGHRKTCVVPIMHYIEENFRECTLKDTAEIFGLNANYMTTLLKRMTGYSFKELVMEQRLQFAAGMILNTDLACDKIITMSGCGNGTYFYKKFKERFGCSPRDYRKKGKTG